MVENRSFEFPQQLMGWNTFGKVQVNDANPAFDRNPHYVTLKESGHRDKFTGLENRGFFGMGLKKGMDYHFSVYARTAGSSQIRVELVGSDDEVMTKQQIAITGNNWKKYTVTLKSPKTDAKGLMRIYLEGKGSVDLDHVSLFPADAWKGCADESV